MALGEVLNHGSENDEVTEGDLSLRLLPDLPDEPESAQELLFADNIKLTRAEVLELFFIPKEVYTGKKVTEKVAVLTERHTSVVLAPCSSFIMPQIRDSYDVNRLLGIGRHIKNTDTGQMQNCGVAFVDEAHIEGYLRDLNTFFQTDISVSQLEMHPEFNHYIITIFGHNRQIGLAAVNREDTGHPDHGMELIAKQYMNPTFWHVLEMQYAENTGQPPDPWDRSRTIVHYKQLRQRDGILTTQEEVAKKFNVDKDQIRQAERFEALPQEIKDLVVAGEMPYSGSFELDRLFKYYEPSEVVRLARSLAHKSASSKQIITEVQKRLVVSNLTPEIYYLVEEGNITLSQAQELNRMKEMGCTDQAINDLAVWICSSIPPTEQLRTKVNEVIRKQISGEVSMFTQDDAMDSETRAAILKRQSDNEKRASIASSMTHITKLLHNVKSLYDSGLAAGAADYNPLASTTGVSLIGFLEKIIEDEVDVLSQERRLRVEIEAFLTQPSVDDELKDVLYLLRDVLTVEQEATSESQQLSRARAAGKVLEIATTTSRQQDSLFGELN